MSGTLDRFLAALSPGWALRRAQARVALETLERHFEGASLARRTGRWQAPHTGPNQAARNALWRLRDRSRDLVRNNPWARSAVDAVVSSVVGTGINPTPQEGPDGGSAKAIANASDLWKDWGETTACDADGRLDFYGLEALVQETVATSGECLVRRRRRRPQDGLPIPLQLQVLEPDFIDDRKDGYTDEFGNRVIQGVAFDALGRRNGYWLFDEHPGEAFRFGQSLVSHLVDANELAHVFQPDRPGQVRGIPYGAPAIIRLRELDELEDAALVREKVAACFAAFEVDATESTDAMAVDPEKGEDEELLEPGTIRRLGAGRSMVFSRPPQSDDLQPMQRSMLRSIARAYAITYEQLTGDYSQVNYSSGRMGWIDAGRMVDRRRWSMLGPQLLGGRRGGAWRWFTEAGELAGYGTLGTLARWTAPRREQLDPYKENLARRLAVRCGFSSLSESLREDGYHPEEVLDEIAQDNAELDARKIALDSDGRRPVSTGTAGAAAG